MPVQVRPETPADVAAVGALNELAFAGPDEARIVATLRGAVTPLVSLVAEQDGAVVGHIVFSPVTLDPPLPALVMGLAPMAVLPAHQRRGIGTALVTRGLEACRDAGAVAVVVVGHPTYYPRFGFVAASRAGLRCEYDVPDEVFMVRALTPGALAGYTGLARFHPAFGPA